MSYPPLFPQTGFSVHLTQLDGEAFTVTVNDVVECDYVLRVPGKGMPRRSGRGFGDLYITFEVDFPDELSSEQKAQLRQVLNGNVDNSGSSSASSETEL